MRASLSSSSNNRPIPKRRSSSSSSSSFWSKLRTICFGLGCFYLGTLVGFLQCGGVTVTNTLHDHLRMSSSHSSSMTQEMQDLVEQTVQQRLAELKGVSGGKPSSGGTADVEKRKKNLERSIGHVAAGVARTAKRPFMKKFDFGVPVEGLANGEYDALVFYTSNGSLPSNPEHAAQAMNYMDYPLLNVEEATANCDNMNVLNLKPNKNLNGCLVVVNNFESYHLQRWMRLPEKNSELDHSALDPTVPLRHVGRGQTATNYDAFRPTSRAQMMQHLDILKRFLNNLDPVLEQLKPLAAQAAAANKQNAIIVMTCNKGQSELLWNFVCAARSKQFDISNILLFATDQETADLAQSMGLLTFYDEVNFKDLPSGEAKRYGDKVFRAMMFAKVFSVQLINFLGYDVLFQDVDMVWFKNPLDYFQDPKSEVANFDIIFQDDGAHSVRFAPYSANSGFYYVRSNLKTQNMLVGLLEAGDRIIQSSSHQQALTSVLNEHASLYGLKVKVLERDRPDFPCGYHFHQRKQFMRDFMAGKTNTYIFHMSWTTNKVNKLKFFQQIGQWYVQDTCTGKTVQEIDPSTAIGDTTKGSLLNQCCIATPVPKCHYKDKPSIIPCLDSPPIDTHGRSFWKA